MSTHIARPLVDDFLAQRSLALVGVSRDGNTGFGNAVRKELSSKGYTLHLVHPEADRIGDMACARSLAEVASQVGGVVLVTPPAQTETLVDEAAALGIRRVWMQQGAESPEALRRCAAHGITPVHGECILMFAEPAAWIHRAHRWARGAFGELPDAEAAHGASAAHCPPAHAFTSLERKLLREVSSLELPPPVADDAPVTEDDLAPLPPPAQRYLRYMGVLGRPRERSFLMRFVGRFLFGGEWVPCECAQYNQRTPVTRVFHMRLRVKEIVPTYVRDTYLRGRGHMLGKVLDAVAMVDDTSEEVTVGECVTYLNDAVLMAPSMLLVPEVTWSDVAPDAFDLALHDSGRTVRARVFVDAQGAVTDFSTTDRYFTPPGAKSPPRRAEWRTPVVGWQAHEGRRFPTAASAVWVLPEGPLPYVELAFDPSAFVSNAPPHA